MPFHCYKEVFFVITAVNCVAGNCALIGQFAITMIWPNSLLLFVRHML